MSEETTESILQIVWTLQSDIRFRRVGDEAVVLAQDEGEILVLNDVGARTLELLDGRSTALDWLPTLLDEYAVEEERLRSDLAHYLSELRACGVLVTVDQPPETNPVRS